MNRPVLYGMLLLFLTVYSPGVAGCQGRYIEERGGFDYEMPRGWTQRRLTGYSYALLEQIGATGKIRRNITFTDQSANVSLEELKEAYKRQFAAQLPGFKLLQEREFKSINNLNVLALVHENTLPGVPIRQMTYVLDTGKGVQFVVSCTVLKVDGDAFDKTFDDLINSFRFLR